MPSKSKGDNLLCQQFQIASKLANISAENILQNNYLKNIIYSREFTTKQMYLNI